MQINRAFSLLELLLVIVITGVIYALMVAAPKVGRSIEPLALDTLPVQLYQMSHDSFSLYVYDHCKKIAVIGNDKIDTKKISFTIPESVRVYSHNFYGDLDQQKFAPLVVEDESFDVCFEYHQYENGSHSSYLIEAGEHFIAYEPYLYEPKVYTTLNDADMALMHRELNPDHLDLQ